MAVVVAYGMLLPRAILEAPRTRLPEPARLPAAALAGRGAIQRAIMAGDAETGIAVMKMEEGLDTGPVGMAERVAITPDMTRRRTARPD